MEATLYLVQLHPLAVAQVVRFNQMAVMAVLVAVVAVHFLVLAEQTEQEQQIKDSTVELLRSLQVEVVQAVAVLAQ